MGRSSAAIGTLSREAMRDSSTVVLSVLSNPVRDGRV
jgi:hypothetical protein